MHETDTGITFSVRLQPRAKRDAIVGELGDALKIALTAPPVDGRANEACIEFLAEAFDVPRSSVTIVSGQNSLSDHTESLFCRSANQILNEIRWDRSRMDQNPAL